LDEEQELEKLQKEMDDKEDLIGQLDGQEVDDSEDWAFMDGKEDQ
jgi:hypothetical protein